MNGNIWKYTTAWLIAIAAALTLSFAAPNENRVMGRMPAVAAKRLDRIPVPIPEGLPADRTLALITFQGAQRNDIEAWIVGLGLRDRKSGITWMRMPVVEDPGSAAGRSAVESKLLARYPDPIDRSILVPVFTDREAFIRAAGLGGPDQMHAVVVNRSGEVLARAGGEFTEDKAAALLETLRDPGF